MEQTISKICKLSHKQFRGILKKFRRKKKRQQLAKEREEKELLEQKNRESSPGYKERKEEMQRNINLYEQFEEKERIRKHKLWLLKEEQAQEEFRKKQKQLEIEKIKREDERKRILQEFEKQQYVENEALEETKKIKSQKEEVLQAALSTLAEDDGPWHNPTAPENYNKILEGLEREQCMFFSKTGCCRFGDRCSRGHTRPEVSRTILIKGMYCHFSIGQTASDDYDTDIALEYEDKETYQDFKNFYQDVLPEFKKFGRVIQFKVCSNFEPHLRGNVYVQFAREENAIEAYNSFNGRYYAGKQISCEFTHVKRWKAAICGLYGRKLCPKGINCNFLHVFKNPNDEFWEADQDLPPRNLSRHHSSRSKDSAKDARSSYEARSSRHDRRDHKSDRYGYRSERHESRRDRYESRSERHESRRDKHESRSDRYESSSDRYESRSDRYESRTDRYESSHYYDDGKTSSGSSDSSEDNNNYISKPEGFKNENSHSSHHKDKYRDSKMKSMCNSPMEVLNGRSNYKKRKHKKKKSRKNKKQKSSDSEN